ncbi:MAG: iron response transcriptional regulator IrrA [Dichotomicrobium sp.]
MNAPAKLCDVHHKLTAAGMRPTRQRIALGGLLFSSGDRHVTAEELHAEAERAGVRVSLATVYNTLHQFTAAGLLREVAIEGAKTYFDTNTSDHYHFYVESNGQLIDIDERLSIGELPELPPGKRVSRVDVLIRLVDSSDE